MRAGFGQRMRERWCRWFGHRLSPVNTIAGVCATCHYLKRLDGTDR